jgi:hypothetical protein
MGSSKKLVRIFVRVGALKRFHTLKQKTAELPVEVSWDRRRDERRATPISSAERPERRRKVPFTWEVADFVVIDEHSPNVLSQTVKRSRKPRKA